MSGAEAGESVLQCTVLQHLNSILMTAVCSHCQLVSITMNPYIPINDRDWIGIIKFKKRVHECSEIQFIGYV